MKLISLNVALFEKNNEKLGKFLSAQQADILCLQEVTRRFEQSADPDLVSIGAVDDASLDLGYAFYAPLSVIADFEVNKFHGEDHFRKELGGRVEFGNYVKSRYPITRGQHQFVQNHFTYVTDWSRWPEEDYRAVQVVDMLINKKPLRLLNYHGVWTKHKQGNQTAIEACQAIKNLALEVACPVIICGDFNLFPDTPAIQLLCQDFVCLPNTYQVKTTRPKTNELHASERNVVDYVFVSPDIEVKNFSVIDSDVSDHLPLVLEFDL